MTLCLENCFEGVTGNSVIGVPSARFLAYLRQAIVTNAGRTPRSNMLLIPWVDVLDITRDGSLPAA